MKRRDPMAEAQRWSTHELFRRGFRMRRARAWFTGMVLGALGFGAVLVIGVVITVPTFADRAAASAWWTDP